MRRAFLLLPAALGIGLASFEATAQSWPTKPLKVIVPFAAGSAIDVIPRVVFDQLSMQIGQNTVIENRPGAGGTTGAGFVAKANPDGYTILAHSSAHTIAPALHAKLGYHPARDFAAVIPLGVSPFILVVPPNKGYKTARDLVAAAEANPGALNFASVGVGSASHLSAERFAFSAGFKATHIPFKGGAEAMTEVMTGRIDFLFVAAGVALAHIRDGKLVALAVNSHSRSAALAEIPTIAQAGFGNAEYPLWFGTFLPARTQREIVDRLYRETAIALQQPKVKARLAALAVDLMAMSSTEFTTLVERGIAADDDLVRSIGLKTK